MRNRPLTALVVARFISLAGTNMTILALPWFVLATTGSTTKMGLVLAFQTGSKVMFGVPGGAVVATLGPRRALVLADIGRAPLLAAVPLLYAAGALPFPALLAFAALIGAFAVPYTAASSALLPDLVGDDAQEVTRAQSALQVAAQATGVLGPVLAGVLIPFIGAAHLLYLDGASYAISAAIVATCVRRPRPAQAIPEKHGMLVGVRFMLGDALFGSILASALVAHVAFAALMASLPALAYREFHDVRVAGSLFTAIAAGSIAGGLLAMRLARSAKPLTLGCAGFALMAAPLWFLLGERPLALVVIVSAAFGAGTQLGVSPITAVLTMQAPSAIRSQTISAFLAISDAGVPVGSAVTGVAIASAGFGLIYAAVAALMTAASLLLIWNVRRLVSPAGERVSSLHAR